MTSAGFAAIAAELHLDEGCRLRSYQDQGGVWTIGYGHTGPEVHSGVSWTQAQADAQLALDIAHAEADLARHLPWFERLDDPRQEAVTNLAFNLGVSGLMAWHHTLTDIEAGRYSQAANDVLGNRTWTDEVGEGRAGRIATLLRSQPVTAHAPSTVVAWAAAATRQALQA